MSVESQRRFSEALAEIIEYYSKEFNFTYAECVGVLIMTAMDLAAEARGVEREDIEED